MAYSFRSVAATGLLTLASVALCAGQSSAYPVASTGGTIVSDANSRVNIHADDSSVVPPQIVGKAHNGDRVQIDCLLAAGPDGMAFRLTDRNITGLVSHDFVRADARVPFCSKPAPVSPNM